MSDQEKPCESAEFREFDFWVGHWILTWPAIQLGGEEGETGTGTNHVVKLFDTCGVEETFSTDDALPILAKLWLVRSVCSSMDEATRWLRSST